MEDEKWRRTKEKYKRNINMKINARRKINFRERKQRKKRVRNNQT